MKYVFVVEDNQGDIDLIETASSLLNRKETIIPLINGHGLMDALKTYNPRFILLDINLPGLNGIKLLKEIREGGHTCPIIVMSSSSHDDDVRGAYMAGANAYIVKPYGIEDLINLIDRVYKFWDIAKLP
jgi:DNA-binding NarL/FixJ family response regulator